MNLIEALAAAIKQGRRYHVFQDSHYVRSYYHGCVAREFRKCGYKVIYLGA